MSSSFGTSFQSSVSSSSSTAFEEDERERQDQEITFLLQEIDGNLNEAQQIATGLHGKVQEHVQYVQSIHESVQVWKHFFELFATSSLCPLISSPEEVEEDHENGNVYSTPFRNTTNQQRSLNQSSSSSVEILTPEFKTCVARESKSHRKQEPQHLSFENSLEDPALPEMIRTPYLMKKQKKKDYQSPSSSPIQVSKENKENRHHFNDATTFAGDAVTTTNDDDESFDLSHQLNDLVLKYTNTETETSMISTVHSDSSMIHEEDGEEEHELSMIEKHEKTPRRFSNLRKRYSISSPAPARCTTANTPNPEKLSNKRGYRYSTPAKQQYLAKSPMISSSCDSPGTPILHSPLLSTKLRSMTPRTPLSNRLAGATMTLGSIAQERVLRDIELDEDEIAPVPAFSLSLFPHVFQTGTGAVEITAVYSKFLPLVDNKCNNALNLWNLQDLLPDIDLHRIEDLVEMLVSRHLLRPFVIEGDLFWQLR